MDILDFACKIELENIDFYATLSRQEIVRELAATLHSFIEEEKSHYAVMTSWRGGSHVKAIGTCPVLPPDPAAVFEQLSGRLQNAGIHADHYYSLYEKAWIFKRICVEFYTSFLKRFTASRRELLMKIIDQERNHAVFFRNMIEFLKRPRERAQGAEVYR
jgi:rubrerythrin